MNKHYTDEKSTLIIIALLKAHHIRKVVASPGATNVSFVASIQNDPYFEVYSSVDERSAAYIACGLAYESNEPVVISCTGATASRNYPPGLTEAFYRKLPVLAITSTQLVSRVGHHVAQVVDRSVISNDIARLSVTLPMVKDSNDFWECEVKVNQALLELKRHGGGPVHINLPTLLSKAYETKALPDCRMIDRITYKDTFPKLSGRTAILIGAHKEFSADESNAIDNFCASKNAVVFCDHTSSYKGQYRVLYSLAASQDMFDNAEHRPDVLIHIGEITGDYSLITMAGAEVWRVSEDGELRDTFRKLKYIFEMDESHFFSSYSDVKAKRETQYLESCNEVLDEVRSKIPDLPFSNIWVASRLASHIPNGSVLHLGILNSLRSWNFFDVPKSVTTTSNVGGFGIDGCLSTLLGASLYNKEKLYFCVLGDLAFFYDMNALGNRHVTNNIRILMINNGKGTEFRQYNNLAAHFGDNADEFVSASGHYGRKSKTLVKNFSEDLGFKYISASDKNEFEQNYKEFINPAICKQPIVFEIFTDSELESEALELIRNTISDKTGSTKRAVKKIIGQKSVNVLKKILRK